MAKPKEITIQIPKIDIPEIKGVQGEPLRELLIPMSGKLITAEDPLIIGKNFRTLTNMRYGDASPKTIGGMTRLNALTVGTPRSAFHYRKSSPSESHVLVQGYYGTAGTDYKIWHNTTPIPGTGDYSITALFSGAGSFATCQGRFSDTPGGKMAYCNGDGAYLWGGNEMPLTGFITSTADIEGTATNPRDYSEVMLNTRSDAANCAVIGGGNDLNTVLLLHCDGTGGTAIVDISLGYAETGTAGTTSPPKTIYVGGDMQITTAQAKFGIGSMKSTSGTNGYMFCTSGDADINHFYFGTDKLTIDFRARFATTGTECTHGLFSQYATGTTNVDAFHNGTSLNLMIRDGLLGTVNLSAGHTCGLNTWYHFAFIRGWHGSGHIWAAAIDGIQSGTGIYSTQAWPDLNADFDIGRTKSTAGTSYFNGWMDEVRISKGVARWTDDFTPPVRAYSTAARYWLIKSPVPLQGVKLYIPVGRGNYRTSTLTVKEFNGYSWQTLSSTDNTSSGGISLAQTGTVTWPSTVTTSKLKYFQGGFGYWYLFSLSAGEADIYYTTLDAPFQKIIDIWDGIDNEIAAFYKYETAYTDYTLNVRSDDYATGDVGTFAQLGALGAFSEPNNCVILGFTQRVGAFNIAMAANRVNTTGTNPTNTFVDYFDGSGFVPCGDVVDGTVEGGMPLGKSGIVSFSPPDPWNVFKHTLADNNIPLYYYRLRYNQALDADVGIYHVTGIPSSQMINGYKFPLYSQDCLMLCCNTDGKLNEILIAAPNTSQVFNGTNSWKVEIGDTSEVNGGCTVFSQYGANLYNITMFFKDREIWNMVWNGTGWQKYRTSETIGCPAGETIDTVIIPPIEGQQGGNRNLAIWEAADGVYISEGRHPICVSHDIRNLWDQTSTTHINLSFIRNHWGKIDKSALEYHLFIATTTGSVTVLDDEWVLDMRRWKWYHVDRTTGLRVQCMINVTDDYGINYSYGFTSAGYMERLDYGNTFDGQDIVSTWQFGNFPLTENEYLNECELKAIVPILKAKSTTADVVFTHYVDSYEAGVDYYFSSVNDDYGLATPVETLNSEPGIVHSLKATITTNTESCGFEPFMVGLYYQFVRKRDYLRR